MGDLESLIPIVGIIFSMGIPIVAILTSHQRKMAELMRGNQNQDHTAQMARELQMMRDELRSLRDQVNRQALALDDRGVQPVTPDYSVDSLNQATTPQRSMPPDLPQSR